MVSRAQAYRSGYAGTAPGDLVRLVDYASRFWSRSSNVGSILMSSLPADPTELVLAVASLVGRTE